MSLQSPVIVGLFLCLLGPGSRAADQGSLDMNAADSALNAPSVVDSRFVVAASRLCAATLSDARSMLLTSTRPETRRIATDLAVTCERFNLALASLERQKGWTLPPPGSNPYGAAGADLSESDYLTLQSANERELLSLAIHEADAGRDDEVRALARRGMQELQRELTLIGSVELQKPRA